MLTRTQAVNQAVNIGGFPPRHIDPFAEEIHTARPGQKVACESIAKRIKDGSTTLLIGPPGTGKTYTACAFAFAWYEREYFRERGKALYFTLAGLMKAEKESMSNKGSVQILERARTCGLMVLDEITVQNDSVFDQRELRDLIDTRYRNKLPTILISNLSTNNLPAAFDGAVLDRILEGDSGVITLDGESHRE